MTCTCSISVMEPRGKAADLPSAPLVQEPLHKLMKDQLIRAIGKTLNAPGNDKQSSELFHSASPTAGGELGSPRRSEWKRQHSLAEKARERNASGAYTYEPPSEPAQSSLTDEEEESFDVALERRERRGSYGSTPPPPEFFCPISHCLMTEPVTLLNTGITFNRTSVQAWMRSGARKCPITGQPLQGWIALESNEKLRQRIMRWVEEQGINFDLLDNAAVLMHQLYVQAG